jgi:hypothetical protein
LPIVDGGHIQYLDVRSFSVIRRFEHPTASCRTPRVGFVRDGMDVLAPVSSGFNLDLTVEQTP